MLQLASAAATAASGPPADSIWAWEDAEGSLHYDRWSAVPVNARRSARPVNGQISTVHAEAPSRVSKEAGLLPIWRPPAPDAPAGPRLNGLTDAERVRQDRATADAAERRRKAEEARFAEIQARNREASWNRSVGVGTYRVNTMDQECTRVGDIVQCRDAKSK
jgi:hypothetical protein